MTASHTSPKKPTPLLALICLAIVQRLRPNWLAVPLTQAAAQERVNPERLSRLATRALGTFESIIGKLTRKGRPPADRAGENAATELALTRGLLEVATSILAYVPLRRAAVRALLVGAYLRLRCEYPRLTQKRFCETLSIPARTLRAWLAQTPRAAAPPPIDANDPSQHTKRRRRRRRGPRRPRFGFDVTVPDSQFAADTTDLSAFGVPLKLIAAQDVGGRDTDLLDAILVDDHECAEHVVKVLTQALADRPGAQLLSDQGTPYLAEQTRAALDELEVEHAVQREADPLGKATIERAFGTAKSIAAPILHLTNRIALAVPALADALLARAVATLLLTALLRAYQAGARAARRADDARAGVDLAALERAAEQSRHRARADQRSARLLLEHIHRAYQLDGPLRTFVRTFRRFPLPVLHAAERDFAKQAHRDDIRNRTAYFARLVRFADDAHRNRLARERSDRAISERIKRRQRRVDAERAAWLADPAAWLRDALDAVAAQWSDGRLLFGGAGLASAWITEALSRLFHSHGSLHTADLAAGVFRAFEPDVLPRIGPDGVAAVRAVLLRHLHALPTSDYHSSSAAHLAAILRGTGSNPRPPPSPRLC
jgi:hypothetical protein